MSSKTKSKKVPAIIIYLLVLAGVYISITSYINRGASTRDYFKIPPPKSVRGKPSTGISGEVEGTIIKSFGTILRSDPIVKEKSKFFRAIRPAIKKKLPPAYPSDDFSSDEWTRYRSFLTGIGNQGKCGSCWAWATSGMLADRFSLLSEGKISLQLSAAKMIMCIALLDASDENLDKDWEDVLEEEKTGKAKGKSSSMECQGNDLYAACQYLYAFGTVTEECVPYVSKAYNIANKIDNIPTCWDVTGKTFDTCFDGKTAARVYRADDAYALNSKDTDIMQEIYKYGSVAAGFQVYDSFLKYNGKSIYMGPKKDSSGNIKESVAGGHAVRIVGWGSENGVDYWWIANSWSEKWGISGYFRMKRMMPECMLEQNVVAVKPEFPGASVWHPTLDMIKKSNIMVREYPKHLLDTNSLYYESAVEQIKQGKLTGDLTPIIKKSDLPDDGDFKTFWVSSILSAKFDTPYMKSTESVKNISLITAGLAVAGVIIISITVK